MMLPKSVGVAHLRTFRNHWTRTRGHQGGTGGSKGKTLQGMSQETNTHYHFTRETDHEPHEHRNGPESV